MATDPRDNTFILRPTWETLRQHELNRRRDDDFRDLEIRTDELIRRNIRIDPNLLHGGSPYTSIGTVANTTATTAVTGQTATTTAFDMETIQDTIRMLDANRVRLDLGRQQYFIPTQQPLRNPFLEDPLFADFPTTAIPTNPIYLPRPVADLSAVRRFRNQLPDTTPALIHRPLPPGTRNYYPPVHAREMTAEQRAARSNFAMAKFSRAKRERTANLFKSCMVLGVPYNRGKSYEFIVQRPLGTWRVNGVPVLQVNVDTGTFIRLHIPIPDPYESGPGILNLTRFLFRMFGIGAVRRKDESVITTSVSSRKLKPGESWEFLPNEINSFKVAERPTARFPLDNQWVNQNLTQFVGQPNNAITRHQIEAQIERELRDREYYERYSRFLP